MPNADRQEGVVLFSIILFLVSHSFAEESVDCLSVIEQQKGCLYSNPPTTNVRCPGGYESKMGAPMLFSHWKCDADSCECQKSPQGVSILCQYDMVCEEDTDKDGVIDDKDRCPVDPANLC